MMKNVLALCVMLGVLATACTSEDKSPDTADGAKKVTNEKLTIGMSQEFENLNPMVSTMLATTFIYKMVNRNLATIDPDNRWVAQIVTSFPTLENGGAQIIDYQGKRTLVSDWEILDNAMWGDGVPVTAEDVAFSVRVGQSPTVSVGSREMYSAVEKVELDPANPKKFRIYYDKIRWDFNKAGTFYILPKHLEESVFEQYKDVNEGYEKNTLYTTDPTNPGLYCGPYRVEELKLGSHVTLIPNEHFYGSKPHIQKIVLRYIADTGVLEASMRSGTIDMISVLGIRLDQALKFEKTILDNKLPFTMNFTPGLAYEHIDLNLSNPFLQDVRVRQALVYAVNRDELTRSLFNNRQKKAIHNISTIDVWHTDDPQKIALYEYSRSKANELLDAAGWVMNEDGYRYKNGEKLSFTIITTAGDKTRELVQVFLQNQWRKVGIEMLIKNEPARVFFGETTIKRKFSAMAMFAWISSPENPPKTQLHSDHIPKETNGWAGQNFSGYVNAAVDEALTAIDTELDPEKRKELVHTVLHHYTTDVPVIPLYYQARISVTPQNLTGYRLPAHQFSSTNHVEDWNLQ